MGASMTPRQIHDVAQRVLGPLVVFTGLFLFARGILMEMFNWTRSPRTLAEQHAAWEMYLWGAALLVTAGVWAWLVSRPVWVAALTVAPGVAVALSTYLVDPYNDDSPIQLIALLLSFPMGLSAVVGNLIVSMTTRRHG